MFFQVAVEQPSVQPEILATIAGFPLTNAILMSAVVTVLVLFVSVSIKKRTKLSPSFTQTGIEMIVESFLNLLESIIGNKKGAEKMLPLIGTLFVYLAIGNLITLLPGIASFTYDGVALFRSPTNDFNLTFSIALFIVLFTHVASLKAFGFFGHLGKFFKFKDVILGFRKSFGDGALAIIDFLIGLLDIISEIAKVISLSLRLFGNIYAGEVLAAILMGSFALLVPAPWLAMNLLVGILQALVFGALSAAYYSLAVAQAEEASA